MKLRTEEDELRKLHKAEIEAGTYTVPRNYNDYQGIILCLILSLFCFFMLYITSKQEIKSLISNPLFYFTDPWNIIDMSIFILAILFLCSLNFSVLNG